MVSIPLMPETSSSTGIRTSFSISLTEAPGYSSEIMIKGVLTAGKRSASRLK
jgi:hypothetical protein